MIQVYCTVLSQLILTSYCYTSVIIQNITLLIYILYIIYFLFLFIYYILIYITCLETETIYLFDFDFKQSLFNSVPNKFNDYRFRKYMQ